MVCIVYQVHNLGMTIDQIEWKVQVQQALVESQGVELVRLYSVAQELFGVNAGTQWAAALSGFDASAVTG
jgi:hypothetical protein